MAIIGRIRKHSALAVIIVGVAIAAFVIGDFGKRRSGPTTDIGSVNGENIPYVEFNNKVEENLEMQRENSGSDKVSEDMAYQVRQNTWNSMIKGLVMDDELARLGMTVSSEELYELIQGARPHRFILQYFTNPSTGEYEPAVIRNYLQNLDQLEPKARDQWLQFEKAIKEDRRETKLNNLIIKSYHVPRQILAKQQEQQDKALKIRYISPRFYSMPDSLVVLTEKDYEHFYNKNISYFRNDEPLVELEFVSFEVRPSPQDQADIASDVAQLYRDFAVAGQPMAFVNANSDKKFDTGFIGRGVLPVMLDSLLFHSPVGKVIAPFQENQAWYMARLLGTASRPDSLEGSQLLITWSGLGVDEKVTRTQAQAKQRADSILAVLKVRPERFEAIAKEASDYPTAKDDGGKLPWLHDGNVNVTPFFEAGISMKPNEVRIVETRLGYSVFLLMQKSPDRPKVKAAVLQRDIEPSNRTFQDTYTRASMFAGTYKTPEAFDSGAIAFGVFKRQAPGVRHMDETVQGLKNARNMVRWAFAEQTKPGEVSPVFDLQGTYAVALLKSRYPAGLTPLADIKDRIEPNVRNGKKIELTADKLTEAMTRISDINELASLMEVKVDTARVTFAGMNSATIARENEVLAELFTSPPGRLAGPFQGNFGVYVAVIDEILPPRSKENFTYEEQMDRQGWENRVSNSLFDALKKQADVVDNRELFY